MFLRSATGEYLSQPVRLVACLRLELHIEGRLACPPHESIRNTHGRTVARPDLRLNL